MRFPLLWPLLAVVSLASACGPAGYRANGIASAGDVAPAAVRTLGCLDVGFALSDASAAASASDWSGMTAAPARPLPILLVRVGNRCPRPAAFDLSKARVVAHGIDGSSRRLVLIDPRAEIVPLHVDAYAQGREKVRLGDTITAAPVSKICVHVDAIAPDAPGTSAPPVCFEAFAGLGWEVR